MKDAPKQIEKIEDIFDVTRFCDGGKYIFRGEKKDYGQVTSGLYRGYNDANLLAEQDNALLLGAHERIIKGARKHLPGGASDIEVLTELQHYGGKTNLIDFTKNLHIALFFACDGKFDEDGRLILVDVEALDEVKDKYTLVSPTGKNPRAIFQSSAFVQPHKGYLEKADYQSVVVKAELKNELLTYLQKHHDISAETVYNDIHGFIRNQSIGTATNDEFYLGLSCSTSGDFEKGILHYTKAIKRNPRLLSAYTNRGINFLQLHRYNEAIADHTKAIELLPRRSLNYFLRGMTYKHAGNLDAAVVDYNKAIEIGHPLAAQHTGLGEIYTRLQNHSDAISEFNKALQIEIDNHDAHHGLAYVYGHLRNYEKALEHLRIERDLCIQKKLLEKAKMLAAPIADLEKTLAEKTRPNTKPTKPKPKK